MTLLLVDDDIALRTQLRFALEKEYTLLEAGNKAEALTLIDNHHIDIALVDLGLPPHENDYQEGKAIVHYIQQSQPTKIIILTGQESKAYAKDLIKQGVFDYLSKPLAIETLLQSLNRAAFFTENEDSDNHLHIHLDMELSDGLKGTSDEAQRQFLLKILQKTHFNIYQSAKLLGISRERIYYFLKKFNIQRPDA